TLSVTPFWRLRVLSTHQEWHASLWRTRRSARMLSAQLRSRLAVTRGPFVPSVRMWPGGSETVCRDRSTACIRTATPPCAAGAPAASPPPQPASPRPCSESPSPPSPAARSPPAPRCLLPLQQPLVDPVRYRRGRDLTNARDALRAPIPSGFH